MKKKSKGSFVFIVVLIAVVFIALISVFYVKISNDINGKNQSSATYYLEITKNDFEYEVGEKLYNNGIVVSSTVWTSWMDKHYPDFEYINGEYNMRADMSYEEIAQKLQNPDVSHKTVKVVIPEGTNAMQIADIMQENNICTADSFLDACRSAASHKQDYDFLESVPDSDLIGYQLEGFLFPATYDIGMNTEPEKVVRQMLDAFSEHYTDEMKEFCTDHNMTLYELLTLASVVQEEAFGEGSAKNIASVFMNRLDKGVKLQSDVTYFYAKDLRDEYGFSQEVYDAYYTYRCDGLPAGPISNSGDVIISSTVNYPQTDYMFFFSDLQQEFHFAKTSEEFLAQQKEYPWQ